MELDKIDRKILAALVDDSRACVEAVVDRVGLSPPVRRRTGRAGCHNLRSPF